MTLAHHILFALLGGVLPLLLFYSARHRPVVRRVFWPQELKLRVYFGNGLLLLALAGAVLTVWYFSGRPLAELGLGWGSPPYDTVAVGVLLAFILLYGVDLYAEAGNKERQDETRMRFRKLGFLPSSGTQYLAFLFLCVCAGVGEEIVYRGFLITYLREMLGTTGWAVGATLLLPAVSFGLAHLYQGAQAVVKIVAMALLFGFFFYRTGSLWPLMLLHTGIDAVGGLLSWYLEERQ